MEVRRNKMYVIAGRKFTGKTTVTLALAKKTGKKICALDTDDHPAYNDFKLTRLEDLHKWKDGNIKVIISDPGDAMTILNKHCSNAFIIGEDAGKYITPNVRQDVRAFIIDHRKRNFDLALMFHFLGDIPPYICKQYDHMILFKTGDNLEVRQNKFANWHVIAAKAERIKKNADMHYCEKIDIDE